MDRRLLAPNYMATRVTVAAVAVDPFQDLWLKHYRPVSDKMITEYGKIELQQFSQKKSHCELKVKCGNVVITGEGKDFKAAFDAFYEKAMAPEIMPYEDD